jgi:hypothetical protein
LQGFLTITMPNGMVLTNLQLSQIQRSQLDWNAIARVHHGYRQARLGAYYRIHHQGGAPAVSALCIGSRM